jgi:hypothetical protein
MSINLQTKRIVKKYLQASQLTDVFYGVVTNASPLQVNVDQRLPLEEAFLIVPEHLTPHSIIVSGQTYEIRRGLEAGDRIILVRSSGGGKYVIVGRLTE